MASMLLTTLHKRSYLLLTMLLTCLFFALYTFFDFRQGGTHLTIFSTNLRPVQFFVEHFGAAYVVLRSSLDLLISLLSAILIAVSLDNYRHAGALFSGTACSTSATVILGFLTFGCPSCVVPIAGTFGATLSSSALPFFGFEFKLLSLLILLGTFLWLVQRYKQRTQPESTHYPSGISRS